MSDSFDEPSGVGRRGLTSEEIHALIESAKAERAREIRSLFASLLSWFVSRVSVRRANGRHAPLQISGSLPLRTRRPASAQGNADPE
jgi:hypothetical protein